MASSPERISNPERALTDRGNAHIQRQQLRHLVGEAEPAQAGVRQHHGVHRALVAAPQARVDVAAQRYEFQVGAECPQLHAAPQ
jgi:hypothetical protein